MSPSRARIGVVGATGAVGGVRSSCSRERGYDERARSSPPHARRARESVRRARSRSRKRLPDALAARRPRRVLLRHRRRREPRARPACRSRRRPRPRQVGRVPPRAGVPLVVPEVNGSARRRARRASSPYPNCCTIPLTMALKPLHDAAGLARVRVATYQSASGAGADAHGAAACARAAVRARPVDGLGLRRRSSSTRRRSSARRRGRSSSSRSCRSARPACACRCSSATQRPSGSRPRSRCPPSAPASCWRPRPAYASTSSRRPGRRPGRDDVLVGRVRRDRAGDGLSLFLVARQPPQGRGPQRDPDRGARAGRSVPGRLGHVPGTVPEHGRIGQFRDQFAAVPLGSEVRPTIRRPWLSRTCPGACP